MSAPIHRNGFSFCDGSFYVEVESGNPNTRHERESASRLYHLLTYVAPTEPIFTNTGKVAKQQPPPHKDPSGHFYRAQLLHYGLPELKTKEPAKKRLLAAFTDNPKGAKVLKVPSNILKLEKEMRVEWTKLNEAEMKKRQEKEAEKVREAELARDTAQFYQQDIFMDVDEDDNESAPIPDYVIEARVALFSLEKAIAEKLLDKVLNQHQDAGYTLRNELEKLGMIKSDRAHNPTDYPKGCTGKEIPGILAQQLEPEPPKPRPRQTARKGTGGRKPPGPKRSINAIAGPSRSHEPGIELAGNSENKAPHALQTPRKGPAIKSKRIRDPSDHEGQPASKKRKNDTMGIHNFFFF